MLFGATHYLYTTNIRISYFVINNSNQANYELLLLFDNRINENKAKKI